MRSAVRRMMAVRRSEGLDCGKSRSSVKVGGC